MCRLEIGRGGRALPCQGYAGVFLSVACFALARSGQCTLVEGVLGSLVAGVLLFAIEAFAGNLRNPLTYVASALLILALATATSSWALGLGEWHVRELTGLVLMGA